ncbi:MAG: molybdate ABC transporter permease subunit, partial [Bacteroidota bacterium]
MSWEPFILTFQLALTTTALLLLLSLPLSYWMAFSTSQVKPVVESIVSLPLVLPPTVIGFYLLVAFSPNSAIGSWIEQVVGLRLVFSFEGLVVASIIYSLPFMVHPIQTGFSQLPTALQEASYVLGKSKAETFFRVLLPNIRRSLLTGIVLAFTHTVGEFGVVLMIGGNIPGETRVASIAIFDEVESLNYEVANAYSLAMVGLSFLILLLVYSINGARAREVLR